MQAISLPGTGATIAEVYASAFSDLDRKTPFDALPQAVLIAVGWHGFMRVKWDPSTPAGQTICLSMQYDGETLNQESFQLTKTAGKVDELFYIDLPYKHASIKTMGDHVLNMKYYLKKTAQIIRPKDWQAVQIPYKIVPPAVQD